MKKLIYFIGSVVLVCFLTLNSSTVYAGRNLTGEELTELFTGKIVEGFNVGKGYTFKAYFRPDGTIHAEYKNRPNIRQRNGKWRVDKKGRKCVKWEGKKKEGCNIIVNDDGIFKEITIKKGKRNHVVTFTEFTDINNSKQ